MRALAPRRLRSVLARCRSPRSARRRSRDCQALACSDSEPSSWGPSTVSVRPSFRSAWADRARCSPSSRPSVLGCRSRWRRRSPAPGSWPKRRPRASAEYGRSLWPPVVPQSDQHLALRTASSLARSWPADEDLIDLDDTLQPITSGTNHRPAQLVQQIPRRAIAPQPFESDHPSHTISLGDVQSFTTFVLITSRLTARLARTLSSSFAR